ncbi:glycosyl hydrolase family 18 [Gracilaria domingensis]|nr:glycosyl hydrolase family 18 [Gracilaria domingensis]
MFDTEGNFTQTSKDEVSGVLTTVKNTIATLSSPPKIMVACGGATDENFWNLMNSVSDNPSASELTAVLHSITDFVSTNELDGVDLDLECWWYHEAPANTTFPRDAGRGLDTLVAALKNTTTSPEMNGKLVSAAVFADWVSVMSYDFTGSWNKSPVGPHSSTYRIKNMGDFLVEQQEYGGQPYQHARGLCVVLDQSRLLGLDWTWAKPSACADVLWNSHVRVRFLVQERRGRADRRYSAGLPHCDELCDRVQLPAGVLLFRRQLQGAGRNGAARLHRGSVFAVQVQAQHLLLDAGNGADDGSLCVQDWLQGHHLLGPRAGELGRRQERDQGGAPRVRQVGFCQPPAL